MIDANFSKIEEKETGTRYQCIHSPWAPCVSGEYRIKEEYILERIYYPPVVKETSHDSCCKQS